MITHGYTCRSGCWSEFIKDFGIGFLVKGAGWCSLRSGPRMKAIQCMGDENGGADQAQKRCGYLYHRKCPCTPPE